METIIREATQPDLEQIYDLIHSAFESEAESDLVRRLTSDGQVLINLLAESSVCIVGSVVVTPIVMEPDIGLFCGAIAPLSVLPDQQSSGIGTKLMQAAISESKKIGIDALFILGDPNYYRKFSFTVSKIKNDYSVENFQELELTKGCLVDVDSRVKYSNVCSGLER